MIEDEESTAFAGLVGATPLIGLPRLSALVGHRVWGKCEFLNPTGSVKDRIAAHIVRRAVEDGLVIPRRTTLVEATAGNTGLALAAAAAPWGCPVIVTMSDKMGPDKVAMMQAWGAEVVTCPYDLPPHDERTFLNVARSLGAARDRYYVNQFENPWNVEAHEVSTGPELVRQRGGAIDMVVSGVGTGGTLMGIGRALERSGVPADLVLADPEGSVLGPTVTGAPAEARPYVLEGIGGDFVPSMFDPWRVRHAVSVPDADSIAGCLWLQREEGLFLGGSAGCAIAAAVRVLADLDGPARDVVVMLPDSGFRYLSTIYSPSWRRARGFPDVPSWARPRPAPVASRRG